jgi:hypothetical protein
MGTFRTLYALLPCERCGSMGNAAIQFTTPSDHGEVYHAREHARDLKPGATFTGCAERFCPSCMYEYHLAENEARHVVMAELVESGRLVIADILTDAPMTPRQILGRRDLQAALIRRAAIERLPVERDSWPAGAQQLTWDGERLDREELTSPGQFEFFGQSLAAVDEWMLEHGWRNGIDWLYEDVAVWVDERGIIGYLMPED